jgi:hypothetical protein
VKASVHRILHVVVEQRPDVCAHVAAGGSGVVRHVDDEALDDGGEQAFLARKVGVQPFLAGLSLRGDAIDSGACQAAFGEFLLGGLEYPLTSRFTG